MGFELAPIEDDSGLTRFELSREEAETMLDDLVATAQTHADTVGLVVPEVSIFFLRNNTGKEMVVGSLGDLPESHDDRARLMNRIGRQAYSLIKDKLQGNDDIRLIAVGFRAEVWLRTDPDDDPTGEAILVSLMSHNGISLATTIPIVTKDGKLESVSEPEDMKPVENNLLKSLVKGWLEAEKELR